MAQTMKTHLARLGLLLALVGMCMALCTGTAFAKDGTVSDLKASGTGDIQVTGTLTGGEDAISVEVWSGGELVAMKTAALESGTFAVTLGDVDGIDLGAASDYTIRAADYYGGPYATAVVNPAPIPDPAPVPSGTAKTGDPLALVAVALAAASIVAFGALAFARRKNGSDR